MTERFWLFAADMFDLVGAERCWLWAIAKAMGAAYEGFEMPEHDGEEEPF